MGDAGSLMLGFVMVVSAQN
ncbi:MAG: hypothetical protein IPQ18_14700 [Saprospiraceae bacterium]|nr:hypothetical protein [Saprospiraceae bacterium]